MSAKIDNKNDELYEGKIEPKCSQKYQRNNRRV
jgi:hypothetical protein